MSPKVSTVELFPKSTLFCSDRKNIENYSPKEFGPTAEQMIGKDCS